MPERLLLAAGLAVLALAPGAARAEDAPAAAPVTPVVATAPAATGGTAASKPAPAPPAPLSDAQRYCQNVAAAAADARFAWQTKRLADLEAKIKQRTDELEAKRADYASLLDRYDATMKKAKQALVDIYAHMRPETAASQIAILDDETAAAILVQLSAGKASAILNEITPERAAKIATAMTSVATAASAEKKS